MNITIMIKALEKKCSMIFLILLFTLLLIYPNTYVNITNSGNNLTYTNTIKNEGFNGNTREGVLEIPLGWNYESKLVIDPATPEPDYQVMVQLDSSEFNYSHAKTDGSDIRFYDVSNNSLNYWVESWNNSGKSIIWVKVPDIGTSKIYMYYGNPSAVSESNGDATFLFFDDFSGTGLNSTKWNSETDAYSTIVVNNGIVNLTCTVAQYHSHAVWAGFSDTTINHGVGYGTTHTNYVMFANNATGTYTAGAGAATYNIVPFATWFTGEIRWINDSLVEFSNGTGSASHTTDIPSVSIPIKLVGAAVDYPAGAHYGALATSATSWGESGRALRIHSWNRYPTDDYNRLQCDWVLVRKSVLNEPAVSMQLIELNTPEAKSYLEPMSGYYPGTYGFEDELHAATGTDLEFIDEYYALGEYVGIGVHDGPIYGHNKVLHIGDAQAGSDTYGVHYFDNPPATGTIEFYNLVDNIHMPSGTHYFYLRAMDDTIAVEMRINVIGTLLSNIEYFDGVSWQLISDQVSYEWYHHSISFDCEAGVNGQFTWITRYENGTESGRVENIEFQNDLNTLDELYLASDVPTYFGATRWDAFGFSWDPNYDVGDNLNEGLLLSYITLVPLIWTGYSLDGGEKVTIFGNTTIPIPALGTHTIQVFGNDSVGTYYQSELRSFQIGILNPPSAPLNLLAIAGENVVTLSWSPPSSDGGSVITHYSVYRGKITDSYTHLNDTLSTSFTDTTAIGGTTYYYVVTAVNSMGESTFSTEISVTPLETTADLTTTTADLTPGFSLITVLSMIAIILVIKRFRKSPQMQ